MYKYVFLVLTLCVSKVPWMLSGSAELSKKAFPALALSPARVTPWVPNAPSRAVRYPTICFLLLIRRKIKQSSKVSSGLSPSRAPPANPPAEAAIDANAPLEDEEEGNGPIDSDEELAAVQLGLANWNPLPVVPPLQQMPIERQYQKARLREQMMNATNGGTINIFKVVGYGAQKLKPDHPHLLELAAQTQASSVDPLSNGMDNVATRRASGFNMAMPPQRKHSGNIARQQ